MGGVLRKIERRQDVLADVCVGELGIGQAFLQMVDLHLNLRRLGREQILLHRPGQVPIQQSLVHLLQLGQPLAALPGLLLTHAGLVAARRRKVPAEPIAAAIVGNAELGQIPLDGLFELVFPPANHRMVRSRLQVAAAIVDVLVDLPAPHLSNDPLARDPVATVAADKQPASQVVIGLPHPPVLASKQILASLEDIQVDDGPVLARVGLPAEDNHADVEAVVEDVGQGRAVEARATGLVGVSLPLQYIGDVLERVQPGRIQLEDPLDSNGVDWMQLDWLVPVALDVLVAVSGRAGGPPLADLLLDALEHLGSQVIRVVLRDRCHHVERQCPSGTGAELVLDEGQLDAAGIFEFLQPHRITHVAAGPVQLMAQQVRDLQFAGVRSQPLVHLVEGMPVGPPLGGLGDNELPDNGPTFLLGLLAVNANLRINGVAFSLLPG